MSEAPETWRPARKPGYPDLLEVRRPAEGGRTEVIELLTGRPIRTCVLWTDAVAFVEGYLEGHDEGYFQGACDNECIHD